MEAAVTTRTAGDENRNWMELPREILATILLKLDAVELLTSVQMVCTQWRSVCLDPYMWRRINIWNRGDRWDFAKICMRAVDLSRGGCLDIAIQYFGNDELLRYIASSGCKLRRLRLVSCSGVSDEGLCEAVGKLPLLEEIEFYHCQFLGETLGTIGWCCPRLKYFKFNNYCATSPWMMQNEQALAIARCMPGLRHLMLFGNQMSNVGLMAVLDGCPHLESLDLRHCFLVDLKGDLAKRCETIRNLRRPLDSIQDYEFRETLTSSEEHGDYLAGFSNIDYFSNDDDDNSFEFSGGRDYYLYDFCDY